MDEPTVRQLRAFQLVSEEGGFARAGKKLGISQAAVSKHVLALEAKLGFQLFERKSGSKPLLTVRGGLVLKDASQFLGTADSLTAFAHYASRHRQTIRISSGGLIAKRIIVPNLGQLQLQRPDLVVELTTLDSPLRAFELSHHSTTHLSYASVPDRDLADRADIIASSESVFAASPRHPVFKQRVAGDQFRWPMIMGIPGEYTDYMVRQSLAYAKITNYYAAHRAQLPEVMVSLAAANQGVCCAFPGALKQELSAGLLTLLSIPRMPVFVCATHNAKRMNEDIRYVDNFFRHLIREYMAAI